MPEFLSSFKRTVKHIVFVKKYKFYI